MTRTQSEELRSKVTALKAQGMTKRAVCETLGISGNQWDHYSRTPEQVAARRVRRDVWHAKVPSVLACKVARFNRRVKPSQVIDARAFEASVRECPTCYLTGRPVNLCDRKAYELVSDAGALRLVCARAAGCLEGMTCDELIALSKEIAAQHVTRDAF
jgi:hypothetical protein